MNQPNTLAGHPGTNGDGEGAPSWLPQNVYDALPPEAKAGINSMRKDLRSKDTLLQQALSVAQQNRVQHPANGNASAMNPNGNGKPPGKYEQYKDEQLASAVGNAFGLLTQGIGLMQTGDPEQIKQAKDMLASVNPGTISEIISEFVERKVTAATKQVRQDLEARSQGNQLDGRVVQEINGLFGAEGFQQDHPITQRATELMGEALQFLGKSSMEELSKSEQALVTRNAYRAAATEINRGETASRGQNRDTTEGPGGGAGTSGRNTTPDEVSALWSQGKKGEAELLAASRLFAGSSGIIPPEVRVSPYGGRLPQPGR